MKKSRFSEEQIAFALRQVEGGASVREVCRKMGISEQTFYRWKRKFAGMSVFVAEHVVVVWFQYLAQLEVVKLQELGAPL